MLESAVTLNGTYTFSIKTVGTISRNTAQQWLLRKSDLSTTGLQPTVFTNKTSLSTVENINLTVPILRVYTLANITLDCTIYPILEEGDVATDWDSAETKYTPNPNYEQPIKSAGDNGSITEKIVNKNWCNGISQNYYLNIGTTNAGIISGNSGLAIEGRGKTYTISTTKVQERMRAACINELPVGSATVTAYRGQNKDNTSNSITIDTSGYKYLIVNITDLSAIQIEEGSTATPYVPHQEQTYTIPTQQPMRSIGDVRDGFDIENKLEKHPIYRLSLIHI